MTDAENLIIRDSRPGGPSSLKLINLSLAGRCEKKARKSLGLVRRRASA